MKHLFDKYGIEPLPGKAVMSHVTRAANLVLMPVKFFNRDRVSTLPLPLKSQLRSWRYGFNKKSYIVYELDKRDPRAYVSDFTKFSRSAQINSVYNACIKNKVNFALTLSSLGVRTPRLHAHLLNGKFRAVQGAKLDDSVPEYMRGLPDVSYPLVFKPAYGGAGKGIFFLDRQDGNFLVNGVPASHEELAELFGSLNHFIVTEYVHQAAYAKKLYAGTVNTLRILTLWDYEKDEPFIAAASHRIGSSRVTPIDNFHGGMGGLSCNIDIETGEIGPGATISEDGKLTWHDSHPETHEPIASVMVPGWGTIADELLAAAAKLPYAPCIGWDLVVVDDGWTCLEGNSPPGLFVWQVHKGLLHDPRVRRFYEHHGVIKHSHS